MSDFIDDSRHILLNKIKKTEKSIEAKDLSLTKIIIIIIINHFQNYVDQPHKFWLSN